MTEFALSVQGTLNWDSTIEKVNENAALLKITNRFPFSMRILRRQLSRRTVAYPFGHNDSSLADAISGAIGNTG